MSLSNKHENFVKSLLRSSWTYLIDVLTGSLIDTDLTILEKILFYDQKSSTPTSGGVESLVVDNADFSFIIFTLRSTLDSLFRVIKLIANLPSMEKELNQLLYILVESNHFKNGLFSINGDDFLSLNKIICLDFVLYTSLTLVCSHGTNQISDLSLHRKESNVIIWKYLVESAFFCFYFLNNFQEFNNSDSVGGEQDNKKSGSSIFLLKNHRNLLKSVYANLNETIRLQQQQQQQTSQSDGKLSRLSSDSNMIGSNEIESKIEAVFKNIFLMVDNKNLEAQKKLSKQILMNQLATSINECLFNRLVLSLKFLREL